MFSDLPPVTRALLWSNGLVYLLQATLHGSYFLDFMLWPLGGPFSGIFAGVPAVAGFQPWQVLTYGFLHGDFVHLLFNMMGLMLFGRALELGWGSRRYALYYFTCLIGAGLVQLVVATLAVRAGGPPYPTLGASGGVFGLLLAIGVLFPNARMVVSYPPIPVKAWILVAVYAAVELVLGVTGLRPGVAHFAHLGGMAFGLLLILLWSVKKPTK